jgi:serine/threonine protein kinase
MTQHPALPAPTPARYEHGDLVLGRYRLEAPIGFGGMGTVWRAHNESLGSPLALKLIRDSVAWPASGSQRLLVEARTTASLRHPAIIRVFDFGETERGDAFIAMELLAGESLRDRIDKGGPLSPTDAVRTLLPILAGLGCAHARGVIHRDLKPDNIFLARDDGEVLQPKVLDFGIAMLQGSVSRMTTAGVLLGSPSYMSPEQALGEENLDLRVDVWSLAVVLYEALAGRTPWHARSCPVLLRAIVDDPPPSLLALGTVDADLWSILLRGLEKRREDRWPSARAFAEALAAWLVGVGVSDDVCGASLRSVWLDHPGAETRASLRSIPPSCTPAVERTTSRRRRQTSERPRASAGRWPMALLGLVAALLLVWGVVARSDRAFAAPDAAAALPPMPADMVVPMRGDGDSDEPGESSAELTRSTASAVASPGVEAHADPSATRAARRPHRAPRAAASAAITVLAAPSANTTAREMDFGF